MKLKLYAVLIISILTFSLTAVKAQTTTTPEFSPSHLQAAERMVEASDILNNMQKVFPTIIKTQASQVPEAQRATFIDVMQKFFAKYVNDDAIKKAFVPIYAETYSEEELNHISDFLLSPAGKAMTAKQPELLTKSMQWGQNVVLEHKDELVEMLKDAFHEK